MTANTIIRRPRFSIWPMALAFNALLLAACVFIVTQEVKQHEASIAKLNRQILAEQQTMRVLDAEWAYLTRPQRIEELLAMRDVKVEPEKSNTDAVVVADVEPSSGVVATPVAVKPEPKVVKTVETKPVKKVVAKAEVIKPKKSQKAAKKEPEVDIVWSIKRPVAQPKQAQLDVTAYPARAGVAKPILE